MKQKLIALCLMSFAAVAFASNDHACQTPGSCSQDGGDTNINGNFNANSNAAAASARSNAEAVGIGIGSATAIQGQKQQQQQGQYTVVGGQNASTNVTVGGGSTNVSLSPQPVTQSVNMPEQPDSIKVKNVPDAPSQLSAPTAPCRIAVGVAGSWMGGSLGIGSSVLDDGCDTREDSRLLFNLGLRTEAIARLCMKPEMATALGEKACPKPQATQPTAYAPANGSVPITQVDGSLESIHTGYMR